jgi:glucosamine--fructose-6-phosphate aminotransferase (isomerizing)
LEGTAGIGHTRWATHGRPSEVNAHPHAGGGHGDVPRFALVHNGILENFASLKAELVQQDHVFVSDTDTEVIVRLVEDALFQHKGGDLLAALCTALRRVKGSYAVVAISEAAPTALVAARKGCSPLVIGFGKDDATDIWMSSDVVSMTGLVSHVVYLGDGDAAVASVGGHLEYRTLATGASVEHAPVAHPVDDDASVTERGNHTHFMHKEIYEQPKCLRACVRDRYDPDRRTLALGELEPIASTLGSARRMILVGCGTSWHAALVGEYLLENMVRIPVEVEYASEFRYRNPVVGSQDVVVAISQSGETADTLAAVQLAAQRGAAVLAICNVPGSSIARAASTTLLTRAGPEVSVASTKSFTAQVASLTLLALDMGHRRGLVSHEELRSTMDAFALLPAQMEQCLPRVEQAVKNIAQAHRSRDTALFLGRGMHFPVALEGALKLKELAYVHAQGCPASEIKHGPLALVDDSVPVFVVATSAHLGTYEKVLNNVQEVLARGGQVVAITTEGDTLLPQMANHVVEIPAVHDTLTPLLANLPLQLYSYHAALLRGLDVDRPRNLAKSVTVE